jgi:hypothetical protein
MLNSLYIDILNKFTAFTIIQFVQQMVILTNDLSFRLQKSIIAHLYVEI